MSTTQTAVINAATLAAWITALIHKADPKSDRVVNPKEVRGRARGDSGKPVLDRYSAGVKPAYASHQYSQREADAIGAAIVASHNKRVSPDRQVTYVAYGSTIKPTRKPTVRKPRAVKPATAPTSAATVAPTDTTTV